MRVQLDDREGLTPGFKFNDWEMRGVPVRIEIGPRDVAAAKPCSRVATVSARRKQKAFASLDGLAAHVTRCSTKCRIASTRRRAT